MDSITVCSFSAFGKCDIEYFLPGPSLKEICDYLEIPEDFPSYGSVAIINEESCEIFPEKWHVVRPKSGTTVIISYELHGSGQGKDAQKGALLIGLVLSVVTAGASMWVAAGGLGGIFGAGTIAAKVLATAISLAGGLAATALSKPPSPESQNQDQQKGPASASGNILSRGGSVPRVIGTRKIYPPLASQPLVERISDEEVVEAIYVLAGPHKLEEIRIGDTLIEESEDVEFEVREGWEDDLPITLMNRYAAVRNTQLEFSKHQIDKDSEDSLKLNNQIHPQNNLPSWHSFSAKLADECWFHMTLPEGLYDRSNETRKQVIPIRIRLRKNFSDTWKYLPELHFSSKKAGEIRLSVLLASREPSETIPGCPKGEGFIAAFKEVAAQVSPPSESFSAHSSFSLGSGYDSLYSGVEGQSHVKNVFLFSDRAEIYLDQSVFDKEEWLIEIKRGCSYYSSSVDLSLYSGGAYYDWFWYKIGSEGFEAPRALDSISDRLYMLRFSSVWNSHPIAEKGFAIIAIKAKGRQLEALSVKASGYVKDWNGSSWNEWKTTSNPAPHFRDILLGDLNSNPIPISLLDEEEILGWREDCDDNNWNCDLIAEGASLEQVLERVSSCGYARLKASNTWGVTRDRDRSAESPSQVFSQRNSNGLTLSKAVMRLPDAFRIIWKEATEDYVDKEKMIFRPGRESVSSPLIEEIRYEGIVLEEAATKRGLFDLLQGELRSSFWNFNAPAEALRVERGDLILVNNPIFSNFMSSSRISSIEVINGMVVSISLDSPMITCFYSDMIELNDMFTVSDMTNVGIKTGVSIRQTDGTISVHEVSMPAGVANRTKIVLSSPVPLTIVDGIPNIEAGCLVSSGPWGEISRRLIVVEIESNDDVTFNLTCVPEAPELWNT
jgi:hypothetical protein